MLRFCNGLASAIAAPRYRFQSGHLGISPIHHTDARNYNERTVLDECGPGENAHHLFRTHPILFRSALEVVVDPIWRIR